MPVTDHQVATLRAQLAGQPDEHRRLLAQLDRDTDESAYRALVVAAFFEAAERRFGKDGTAVDVVEFVGDVRARSEDTAEKIDPQTAELLLRSVCPGESVTELPRNIGGIQLLLLAALVADEQFDDAGLDEFLSQARAQGDRLLS